MENKRENFNTILRSSGILLLFFIVNTILLTGVLYFINITITIFHAPAAFVLAILETILLYKKQLKIKQIIISIILSVLILTVSIILTGQIYDLSCDGNAYHKTAIGNLKNGWNPVYENVEDYTIEKGNKINVNVETRNHIWINHYPKASWIFAANIYKLTNNIEASKVLNLLMIYICFCIVVTYLNKKIGKVWSIIIAILITINPITFVQLFTNYIDGLLGISLSLILYCLIILTELKMKKDDTKNKEDEYLLKEHWIILANILVLAINLKFTGIVYSAIFCFLFYIYWLYQAHRKRKLENKSNLVHRNLYSNSIDCNIRGRVCTIC